MYHVSFLFECRIFFLEIILKLFPVKQVIFQSMLACFFTYVYVSLNLKEFTHICQLDAS